MKSSFEWDTNKNTLNISKHSISFEEAQHAFKDERRIVILDEKHSKKKYELQK